MPDRIPNFLQSHSKFWRLLGSLSAIIGLVCYALSSSFKQLFAEWNFLKLLLYILICSIICYIVLCAKRIQVSRGFILKAHGVFFIILLGSVYSVFYDEAVSGKPDALSIISYSSFALMSLSVSRKLELGFETGLFNFFLGCLTVQLMKISWFLSLIAVVFSYALINFRCYLDSQLEIVPTSPEDHHANGEDIETGKVSGESISRDNRQVSEEDDNLPSLSSEAEPPNLDDIFGDNHRDNEENKSSSSLTFQAETTNQDNISSENNVVTRSVTQNSDVKQGYKVRGKESKFISRELASAINDGLYFYEQELKNRWSNRRKNNYDNRDRKLKSTSNTPRVSDMKVGVNISESDSSTSPTSESSMEHEGEEPMIQTGRSNPRGRIKKKPS